MAQGNRRCAAGVAGQSDSSAHVGLDLNLITFAASTFSGSSFIATTFQDAVWTGCQFSGCASRECDMQRITISGCTFVNCTFASTQLSASKLSSCSFRQCNLTDLNLDASHWSQVGLLDCTGERLDATDLQGQEVDFTGSQFKDMHLRRTSTAPAGYEYRARGPATNWVACTSRASARR